MEDIRQGKLATTGLYSQSDAREAEEVVRQAHSNGLETIRVLFADAHGILRGKTIVSDALVSLFSAGLRVPQLFC